MAQVIHIRRKDSLNNNIVAEEIAQTGIRVIKHLNNTFEKKTLSDIPFLIEDRYIL